MEPVIEVQKLRKEYKNFTAVDNIDFTVYRGDVFGFLGPNGAGKSTTIRMITSLIKPTSGEVRLFGKSLRQHRAEVLRNIGAIVERPDMYLYLSAYTNLEIFAKLTYADTSKEHLMKTLELVGLASRSQSKVKTFSHGMKQRLGIATALVHNPDLIILDEPTTGLDPQGMKEIREIILHLSHDLGKTIFLSSHILPEVEMIANRMVIINRGKIVVEGDVQQLLGSEELKVEVHTDDVAKAKETLATTAWGDSVQAVNESTLSLTMNSTEIPQLIERLVTAGVPLKGVVPVRSLEDFFMQMITQS